MDASLGWYRHALALERLARALVQAEAEHLAPGRLQAFRLSLKHVSEERHPLRRSETYAQRRVYSSAISHLENALRLASVPHPGFRLRVADVEAEGLRPHRAADLEALAGREGPFDAYFREELIPRLEAEGVTHVALSLTFLNQAFAAFRLAALLEERLPSVRRLLGGPLAACWEAVGARLDAEPFTRFHAVLPAATPEAMEALARAWGGRAEGPAEPLAPELDATPWEQYLVPVPTVPAALGRGCYWRRCAFCPDHLHPGYAPCSGDGLEAWLHRVAARFPGGAMLHLTDSALSPALLDRVAAVVRRDRLPLRWHGFVRMEARFADPAFMAHLAEGGCAMLQWGLESASERLLRLMDKGVGRAQARAVLRAASGAGIRSHAYLLFGLPTETDLEREESLAFVQEEAAHLHDLNVSLLNLPRNSPMHAHPEAYGITAHLPFGDDADLSLYDDFRCGKSHPRLEARRWLGQRFFRDAAVKALLGDLKAPFKANHGCFLP